MTFLFRQQLFQTRIFFIHLKHLRSAVFQCQHRLYTYKAKAEKKLKENKSLQHVDDHFESVPHENRDKEAFLDAIDMFKRRSKNDRGYVEFIYSAMNHMKDYGLQKDLEVYKAILNVFPAGPLMPQNVWQKMFFHYPHQQACCIKVLDEMEWNLVYPDIEIFEIVKARFGPWSQATKKTRRMLYWYPRLRYANKYINRTMQDDRYANLNFLQLAKLGLEMMCRDKGTQITYTKIARDQSLIVSAQSALQRRIIARNNPPNTCYYINGPFLVYVSVNPLQYVTFTTDPGPKSDRLLDCFVKHEEIENLNNEKLYKGPLEEQSRNGTVHEQVDQTILALAVLENNDENSASAWINHLQTQSPNLQQSTIIIRLGDRN